MPGIEWLVLYILLGSLVGFMAGLLGVGGGGILVPLLVSIFTFQGMNPDKVVHMALGTALACMILSSISSTRAHAIRGAVVWKIAGGMAPGIMIGTLLTTYIAASINGVYIAAFFTAFMALVSIQLFANWKPKPGPSESHFHELLLVGTGIGSISALAAVGGGFLSVAYMTYKNLDIKKAIGTSAALGFSIAITGTLGYMISGWSETTIEPLTLGFMYVPAFIAVSLSSIAAAAYGVRWAHRLPDAILRKLLGVISLILSVKMFFSVVNY
jgi:uncharacterized membrane protein YfcA